MCVTAEVSWQDTRTKCRGSAEDHGGVGEGEGRCAARCGEGSCGTAGGVVHVEQRARACRGVGKRVEQRAKTCMLNSGRGRGGTAAHSGVEQRERF